MNVRTVPLVYVSKIMVLNLVDTTEDSAVFFNKPQGREARESEKSEDQVRKASDSYFISRSCLDAESIHTCG